MYNTVVHYQENRNVHSVIVLLRKSADSDDFTGTYRYDGEPGKTATEFVYQVYRVWENDAEDYLTGGLGTLPLAVLGKLPVGQPKEAALERVVDRLIERLLKEAPIEVVRKQTLAAYVLAGLVVDKETGARLFRKAEWMHESSTYQAIIEEGLEKGLQKGLEKGLEKGLAAGRAEGLSLGEKLGLLREAKHLLIRLGKKRLGEPSSSQLSRIEALDDLNFIEERIDHTADAKSWEELLVNVGVRS